jgi:ribosome biogenesis GTPase A
MLQAKTTYIFDFNGSWLPGLHRFVGNNKVLLVGNKADLIPKSKSALFPTSNTLLFPTKRCKPGNQLPLKSKISTIYGSWLPGLHRFVGNNKVLLVGNKADLIPKSVKHDKVKQNQKYLQF